MLSHKIIKSIVGLLAIWLLAGIISIFMFRSENQKAIPIGTDAGWVQLSMNGQNDILNFEFIDNHSSLLREGSTLKVKSDNLTLKENYYFPLWWVPFIEKPHDLGTLNRGDCIRIADMHRLAGKWTWLLVTRTSCPKALPQADKDSTDTEIETFMKNTMKNIYQFKEDVKEYIEEIERTAKELEEYEQQLEESSGDNNNNKL